MGGQQCRQNHVEPVVFDTRVAASERAGDGRRLGRHFHPGGCEVRASVQRALSSFLFLVGHGEDNNVTEDCNRL